jgi:Cytochrome c
LPHVAWRTVAGPSGTLVAVHQAESTASLQTQVQGGYGGSGGGSGGACGGGPPLVAAAASAEAGCGTDAGDGNPFEDAGCADPGAVISVLTVLASDGSVLVNTSFNASLPVDVAVSRDGSMFAAVAPGDAFVDNLGSVFWLASCGDLLGQQTAGPFWANVQATAAAFDTLGRLVVQSREPAALWIYPTPVDAPTQVVLSTVTRDDTGHDIFHTQGGGMIACASCHPEGRDDGHVWQLDGELRRTPSLRGTIPGTAPYHWLGDEPNLTALVDDVYTIRMDGASLPPDQMSALQGWVQSIPAPPAPSWVDPASASRGQALFTGQGACSTCHSGARFTNNQDVNVGTGGAFQVPPLVGVGWNTPLLHDGCAATLADRFGKCGTPSHGATSALSAQNIDDLISYLETL